MLKNTFFKTVVTPKNIRLCRGCGYLFKYKRRTSLIDPKEMEEKRKEEEEEKYYLS